MIGINSQIATGGSGERQRRHRLRRPDRHRQATRARSSSAAASVERALPRRRRRATVDGSLEAPQPAGRAAARSCRPSTPGSPADEGGHPRRRHRGPARRPGRSSSAATSSSRSTASRCATQRRRRGDHRPKQAGRQGEDRRSCATARSGPSRSTLAERPQQADSADGRYGRRAYDEGRGARAPHQDLRHHQPRGRRARRRAGAWALGHDLLADGSPRRCAPAEAARDRRARCAAAPRSAACSSTRRSTRSPALADGARPDDGPAARRRGPGVLPRSRGAPARRSSRRRAVRVARRRPGAGALPHSTSTSLDAHRDGHARRHGRDRSTGSSCARAARRSPLDPQRRPDARERRRRRSPRCGRSRSTSPAAPRPRPGVKDPEKLARLRRPRSRRPAPRVGRGRERAQPRRRRASLRPLRRPVRPRDADARAGRARGGVGRGARRRRLPRRARRGCCATSSGARRRCTSPSASARSPAARSGSSARTSCTPARTRSTTRSARRCWPSAWASRGSSPRPAPASTASPAATACALLDLECVVYMGAEDIRRQQPNVQRMELLGASVVAGRGRRADAQGGGLARRSATG